MTMKITSPLLALALLAAPAIAGPPKKHHEEPMQKIFEVSPLSITLGLGHTGEMHVTYTINDATKIRLEGQPVAARDLRAGMEARVKEGSNHTAISIEAKGAVAHPRKGRDG